MDPTRASRQNHRICAPKLIMAEQTPSEQNGGYWSSSVLDDGHGS
jgi:hypothetical protein